MLQRFSAACTSLTPEACVLCPDLLFPKMFCLGLRGFPDRRAGSGAAELRRQALGVLHRPAGLEGAAEVGASPQGLRAGASTIPAVPETRGCGFAACCHLPCSPLACSALPFLPSLFGLLLRRASPPPQAFSVLLCPFPALSLSVGLCQEHFLFPQLSPACVTQRRVLS